MQTKGWSCFKRSSSCKRIFLWDRSDGEYFSVNISMETEILHKNRNAFHYRNRNMLPNDKRLFFGGDPGNWGIFWGPYEPSSKCGHGCLGQVAYQNISIFMSQDLWRFSEPIDVSLAMIISLRLPLSAVPAFVLAQFLGAGQTIKYA